MSRVATTATAAMAAPITGTANAGAIPRISPVPPAAGVAVAVVQSHRVGDRGDRGGLGLRLVLLLGVSRGSGLLLVVHDHAADDGHAAAGYQGPRRDGHQKYVSLGGS